MLTGKQGLRPSVKCWTSTPNHRLGITDLKYAKSVDNILDVMLFLYRDSSYHAPETGEPREGSRNQSCKVSQRGSGVRNCTRNCHACRLNVNSCAILFLTIYSAKEIAVYAQL